MSPFLPCRTIGDQQRTACSTHYAWIQKETLAVLKGDSCWIIVVAILGAIGLYCQFTDVEVYILRSIFNK